MSLRQARTSTPPFHDALVIQKREEHLRNKEFARLDIVNALLSDSTHRGALERESKADGKRRLNAFKMQIQEQQMQLEKERKEHEKEAQIIQKRMQEETERKEKLECQEAIRLEKYKQAIFENSQELKDLEKKLNEAYTNKHLALQIQENILTLKKAQAQKIQDAAAMKVELEHLRIKDEEQEIKEHERVIEYQNALEVQLNEKEEKKIVEYEIFLKEKAKIDAIVQKILMENEKQLKDRFEKRQETQNFIQQFLVDREKWQAEENRRRIAEEELIQKYAREQQERIEMLAAKKKAEKEAQGNIYQFIAQDMEAESKKRLELEDLRIELLLAENEEKDRKLAQEAMEKRIKLRLELIGSYYEQIRDKRARIQKQVESDDEFKRKMMEKYAEDDRIEQMNSQKRRMKMLEHGHIVQKMIQTRQEQRAQEIKHEREFYKREEELERYKNQVIEQERRRLLLEHAKNLVGFLPKGALRNEKDLELFDEDFRKHFEKALNEDEDDE